MRRIFFKKSLSFHHDDVIQNKFSRHNDYYRYKLDKIKQKIKQKKELIIINSLENVKGVNHV